MLSSIGVFTTKHWWQSAPTKLKVPVQKEW